MMENKYSFYNNCVGWDFRDVDAEGGLSDMIDSGVSITRKTFLKHVGYQNLRDIEQQLGYGNTIGELKMANDWAVSYSKSKLHGKTVYYFTYSAIEYVFTQEDSLNEIETYS